MTKLNEKVVNQKQLEQLADDFSKKVKNGDIIGFSGELGVGKTTFIKRVAKNLKIKQNITSPTFNLIKQYEDIFCHVDAYRIVNQDIGLDYYLDNDYIILIEWYQNIIDYLPKIDYVIDIEYYGQLRKIKIMKMR